MKFWGVCIDPSKAQKYELPLVENILPPSNDPSRPIITGPTVTKTHSKPTAYLPEITYEDNDDSFLSDISDTVIVHKKFFGGVGLIALIALVAGIYLVRRRTRQLKNYATLASDEHPMVALAGVSEPDDLGVSPGGRHPQDRASVGLGFHSGFLDDDDLSTAATAPAPKYRDEPDVVDTSAPGASHADSPGRVVSSPRVSGDGSWEHARKPSN